MGMNSDHLVSVGIDFRTAPVHVRERWAIDDDALARIRADEDGLGEEWVVIRTCNRTQFFVWTRSPDTVPEEVLALWSAATGSHRPTPETPVSVLRGAEAGRHLMRVASGLESQILGDIHILGQVRRCYRNAREAGTVGPHLHRLFDAALRAGKRVRRETALMAGQQSVGSEAARFLVRHLPPEAPRRIVVLGAGKVGSHAARYLAVETDVEVILLNRTPERARDLAAEWAGSWGGLESLPDHLSRAGGLLVATGAPRPWVDAAVLAPRAEGRTLPVVDVSMPRNVDPDVADLRDIWLRDLDRVHPEAAEVESARQEAIPTAEDLLEEELEAFTGWVSDAGAREALRPLRELVVDVCRREVGHVAGTEAEAEAAAERAARRIAAKVMARPMMVFRGEAPTPEREALSRALLKLFGDEAQLASSLPGQRQEPARPHTQDSR